MRYDTPPLTALLALALALTGCSLAPPASPPASPPEAAAHAPAAPKATPQLYGAIYNEQGFRGTVQEIERRPHGVSVFEIQMESDIPREWLCPLIRACATTAQDTGHTHFKLIAEGYASTNRYRYKAFFTRDPTLNPAEQFPQDMSEETLKHWKKSSYIAVDDHAWLLCP